MKTNPPVSFLRLVTKAASALLLTASLTNASASVPPPCVSNPPVAPSANHPAGSFEEQIRQYIRMDRFPRLKLAKGIVVISFSLNEDNHLSGVVSYSQNRALDLYLVSCLEGKTIRADHLPKHQKHYLKIRFHLHA
ncbi:MAG: hypothetical protein H7Z75_09760 [Ferruginibacter sp.]|nr:hypothetical protein [Cytophagales bacterium]